MAFIGALIGGFTNHLAIKMLFRPHEARYIGKWRVPFTPGLIPKRRDELAKSMGRTVVEHLLTPETFKRRFFSVEMRQKAQLWIQVQLTKHIFETETTLKQWLERVGVEHIPTRVEGKIDSLIDEQMTSLESRFAIKTIREIAPEQWLKNANERVPEITAHMIVKAETYFVSDEGRLTVKRLIDDFLASKGAFGNMINMFMGDSSTIVNRVQPEIQKFLHAPGTSEMISNAIRGEWEKLKDRSLNDLIGGLDLQPMKQMIKSYVKNELSVEKRLDVTLQSYWPNGAKWTADNLTPKLIEFAFKQGETKLGESIQRLQLEDIVKEQVDSFPVERLEDLVLGISKREFKMITVLGAVLGGLIGVVQGGVMYVINMM
ncbi:DUF445 domain-containing protein [Paenisporosarcina indica]|uniref:DUF445 domain-containing protein n=1 Tax=Paenisporosarcina indica TaxID=650093 RepID=UPI00094F7144|nr:DUF445 family protein [Paenisporosarcina indica]